MKLVEILARELGEWPESPSVITQDDDGFVFAWTGSPDRGIDQWLVGEDYELTDWRYGELDLADDSKTAIVTHAQWQEAREALNKPAELPPVGATHCIKIAGLTHSWWMREPGDNWYLWSEPAKQWALDTPSAGQRNLMKAIVGAECIGTVDEPWNGEGLPPVGTECEINHVGEVDSRGKHWRRVIILAHHHDERLRNPVAVYMPLEGTAHCDQAISICFRPIRTPEQIAIDDRANAIAQMMTKIVHGDASDMGRLYDAGYRKVKDGNQNA